MSGSASILTLACHALTSSHPLFPLPPYADRFQAQDTVSFMTTDSSLKTRRRSASRVAPGVQDNTITILDGCFRTPAEAPSACGHITWPLSSLIRDRSPPYLPSFLASFFPPAGFQSHVSAGLCLSAYAWNSLKRGTTSVRVNPKP